MLDVYNSRHVFSGEEVGSGALMAFMDNSTETDTYGEILSVSLNKIDYDIVSGSANLEAVVSESMGPVVLANTIRDVGTYVSISNMGTIILVKLFKQQYDQKGNKRYPDNAIFNIPSAACVARQIQYQTVDRFEDNVNSVSFNNTTYAYEERYMLAYGGPSVKHRVFRTFNKQESNMFLILGHTSLTYLSVVYFEHSLPGDGTPPVL